MGKVIVTEFMSLDGVMENPAWTMPYWNDTIAEFKGREFHMGNSQLLGRVTYEGFAAAWPDSEDEGAPVMNNMPKYIVSTTLQSADWNNSHIIRGDVAEEISKLTGSFEGDLIVSGSAKLVQFLLANDLVDELHLLVYPVVLGTGKRLFGGDDLKFELIETRHMDKGVVLLRYAPVA